jgi:hypothetical protein
MRCAVNNALNTITRRRLNMRTIIAGSRDITDLRLLETVIEDSGFDITEVVCGGARGVDALGRTWAGNGNRAPVKMFPAKWDEFGKSAGYRRNVEMADYGEALIAIWDGASRGTKHMIDIATSKGLKIYVRNLAAQ